MAACSVAWGDYDNDGDLDLAVAGEDADGYRVSIIYRNDDGTTFTDIGAGLTGVSNCSLAWGDYDNDGDLDLVLAGQNGLGAGVSTIYNNNAGVFSPIGAGLTGVYRSSVAWGDYDNDGDLDLALAGQSTSTTRVSIIYRNEGGGGFVNASESLVAVNACSVAWGDYDGDDDLDLVLAGYTGSAMVSKVYRNDGEVFNTLPSAPTVITASSVEADALFSWNAGSDAETPVGGLSYNLRVGTSPGDDDVFSGMADAATGLRLLPALGNAQKGLSWPLRNLQAGVYYYSVQTIDTAFAASPWAEEEWVDVAGPTAPGVKGKPDGTFVECDSCIISASFEDFFYIKSADGSWGIRVEMTAHGLPVGTILDVEGTVETNADHERYIAATLIRNLSTGSVLPVGMTNMSIGGGPLGLQVGVKGGYGTNNIGLLIKSWGTVTEVDPAETPTWFRIDDSSGIGVKCLVPSGVVIDPGWTRVTVVGACSCEDVGGEVHRLIRVRTQDDIVPY